MTQRIWKILKYGTGVFFLIFVIAAAVGIGQECHENRVVIVDKTGKGGIDLQLFVTDRRDNREPVWKGRLVGEKTIHFTCRKGGHFFLIMKMPDGIARSEYCHYVTALSFGDRITITDDGLKCDDDDSLARTVWEFSSCTEEMVEFLITGREPS